jgi:hypothetical protein
LRRDTTDTGRFLEVTAALVPKGGAGANELFDHTTGPYASNIPHSRTDAPRNR